MTFYYDIRTMAGSSLLIGYLYFVQGVVLSLPAVLPLTYRELPGYTVLSLFSAAWLPFSFKFISGNKLDTQLPSSRRTPGCSTEGAKPGSL